MAIHLLDTHTAELIAAGEVVERPASVVKELLENALDAGASSLAVEIERGGIALIRITDDGTGIEVGDMELAFTRHATSKVRTGADLEAINTLGFRGEALASIASVSRVEVLTKHDGDDFATRYTVAGGQPGTAQEDARPRGTTITVRDLFYNTPARMKFLKKDSSEGVYVTETVTRLALSHPEVSFRYVREGRQVFATPGDGDLRAAAYSVLGPDFARALVPVDCMDGEYRVTGFVTPPRAGRASRGMQFFFVNGRYVKNRTMMAALEQAYRGMMLQGKFPGGVLFLYMPPGLVDVNVHPAKTEVRFAKEQDVFGQVYRAVKAALLENEQEHNQLSLGKKAETSADAGSREEEQPIFSVTLGSAPAPGLPTRPRVPVYDSVAGGSSAPAEMLESTASVIEYQLSAPVAKPMPDKNWRKPDIAYQNMVPTGLHPGQAIHFESEVPAVQQELVKEDENPLRLVGELFKTYIVAEQNDTLCLIDKHAAHERILYEQIATARGSAAVQQLLAPVNVSLSAAEKNALLQNEEALKEVGLALDDFGGNTVLVRGVPADIEVADIEGLVVEMAQRLSINAKDTISEKTEWVMHSIACRAAIKGGDKTSAAEMLSLAKDILSGAVPPFCPHGRPVVLEITRKELEKQFGRLG